MIRILFVMLFIFALSTGCSKKDEQEISSVNPEILYNISPEQFIDRFTTTVIRLIGKNAPMNWPNQPTPLEEVSGQNILVASYELAPGLKLSGVFDKSSKKLKNTVLIIDKITDAEDLKGVAAYIWLISASFDPEITQEIGANLLVNLFTETTKNGGAPSSISLNGNTYTLSLNEQKKLTFVMAKI